MQLHPNTFIIQSHITPFIHVRYFACVYHGNNISVNMKWWMVWIQPHNLLETVARRWMVWVSHLVTPINTMLQGRSMMDVLPMRHAMALWEMQNYHVVLGNNMSSADRVSRQWVWLKDVTWWTASCFGRQLVLEHPWKWYPQVFMNSNLWTNFYIIKLYVLMIWQDFV